VRVETARPPPTLRSSRRDASVSRRAANSAGAMFHAAGSGSSARSRRTRSSAFGCVTKSAAMPSSSKGLNGHNGSVAGDARKLDELCRPLHPYERVREAVRRLAQLRSALIRLELALPADREHVHARRGDRRENEQKPALEDARRSG